MPPGFNWIFILADNNPSSSESFYSQLFIQIFYRCSGRLIASPCWTNKAFICRLSHPESRGRSCMDTLKSHFKHNLSAKLCCNPNAAQIFTNHLTGGNKLILTSTICALPLIISEGWMNQQRTWLRLYVHLLNETKIWRNPLHFKQFLHIWIDQKAKKKKKSEDNVIFLPHLPENTKTNYFQYRVTVRGFTFE